MRNGFVGGVIAAMLAVLSCGDAAAEPAPAAQTQYGPVTGLMKGDVVEFLGIPFAAPPVGQLRWRPPVAPKPWTAPLAATKFAPVCAQIIGLPYFSYYSESEDCLYLNVFAPANQSSKPAR